MTRYHCDFAWLGGTEPEPDVTIDVEGERITRVVTGERPRDATHLPGLTLPGLVNTHSHAFHRALRGRTQRGGGTFWTWRDQMYRVAERLEPDLYHRLARATFGEMVSAGITLVGEFHYVHHAAGGVAYAAANAMGEALVAAARDAGIRLTLLDSCYLAGGIGVRLEGVQRRFTDGDAGAWAARVSARGHLAGPDVRLGAAIHSVRAVPPDAMRVVAEWAAQHDAPLHAHVSEQPAENEQCRAAYGRSPVELLDEQGVFAPRFTAVHATHTDHGDRGRLGRSGSTVCLCPTTERDLGDGVAAARRMLDAGVRLALGSDSHAVVDLLEEARAVELDERLAYGRRGLHSAATLLTAATDNGAAALGWAEAGRVEAGALADLCTVRLDSVRTAGARRGHVLDHVVFAAGAADVTHVMVGGRVVVEDGRHTSIDVARDLDDVLAAL